MNGLTGGSYTEGDPILAAVAVGHPIDLEVIDQAIKFREFLIAQVTIEVHQFQDARGAILAYRERYENAYKRLQVERDPPVGPRI